MALFLLIHTLIDSVDLVAWGRQWATTDQVVVGVLGPQHACDILKVVCVDLLRAGPGEGHSNDALCDVGQVQLVSLLHYELVTLPVQKNRSKYKEKTL